MEKLPTYAEFRAAFEKEPLQSGLWLGRHGREIADLIYRSLDVPVPSGAPTISEATNSASGHSLDATNGPAAPQEEAGAVQNGAAELTVGSFPRNRHSMMMDLAIYLWLMDPTRSKRSIPVSSIHEALSSAGLLEATPKQRASLVTKLNRHKANGTLTWPNDARGKNVVITGDGVKEAEKLLTKDLLATEIEFLKTRASWLKDAIAARL